MERQVSARSLHTHCTLTVHPTSTCSTLPRPTLLLLLPLLLLLLLVFLLLLPSAFDPSIRAGCLLLLLLLLLLLFLLLRPSAWAPAPLAAPACSSSR